MIKYCRLQMNWGFGSLFRLWIIGGGGAASLIMLASGENLRKHFGLIRPLYMILNQRSNI